MTGLERIQRATIRLWLGRTLAALLIASSAGMLTWLTLSLAGLHAWAIPVAIIVAVAVVSWAIWQARALRAPVQVGLWVEEQDRSLRYAFVTAVELEQQAREVPPELAALTAQAPVEAMVSRSLLRALRLPIALFALMVLALITLGDRAASARQEAVARRAADSTPAASRLTPLEAVVTAPYYARHPVERLSEPEQITGLVGSTVVLHGRGAAAGVIGRLGADSLPAVRDGSGWALPFALPALPVVLRLQDRVYSRLVTLDPRPDSVPEVVLRAPERDTTYQVLPTRPVRLVATARDDIGLGRGHWELLITTGSGEQFETVTRNAGHRQFDGSVNGVLDLSIRLDTFGLTPGSVINLRAIAFDRNDVSGPGRGVSDTRTLRLAAVLDSTGAAAEPAIPIDSMWMSQRLLNLRTDTLLLQRRRLARTEFGSRGVNLSNSQETIRGRVLAVIAVLEDDGFGGREATEDSRLLRQAADAMQEARFLLAVAAADSARPHMRRALAILDQIRTAKRYHLRGVIRPTPVDIATVRLTGSEKGAPAPAEARAALPASDREIARRIELHGRLHGHDPAAAVDSLTVLQAELLQRRPALATALAMALSQLREGAAPGPALAPVRLQLARPPVRLGGAAAWSGGGDR